MELCSLIAVALNNSVDLKLEKEILKWQHICIHYNKIESHLKFFLLNVWQRWRWFVIFAVFSSDMHFSMLLPIYIINPLMRVESTPKLSWAFDLRDSWQLYWLWNLEIIFFPFDLIFEQGWEDDSCFVFFLCTWLRLWNEFLESSVSN